MARSLTCDICGKETAEIAAKMFYSETGKNPLRSKSAKSIHNNYNKHLDVGVCCADRVVSGFKWRDRMTKDEYNISRAKNTRGGRKAPSAPVEAKP